MTVEKTKPTNTSKVIRGISSQTIVTLLLGLVEIVSFSFMSRLLTKTDFGYYAAILAVVVIFASFSETGIGAAIVQKKKLTKRYVDTAFTLSLLFGIVISLLLFTLSGLLAKSIADESMIIPLKLMSITLFLHSVTSIFISIMQRRLEFLRIGYIHLVSLVITTCVAVFLAYLGYGYYSIIVKAVLQSVLNFFIAFYFCKTKFKLSIDRDMVSSIFHFSGWLMASVVFRNLSHQVDKLLMPRLLSVEALGAYNRPKDFINQISTKLNGIFDTALFPVLSSIQDEEEKLKKAFRQSLTILNIFAMLLTLSFAFNSELIIQIFFGSQWMSLNTVTIVISFALVFNIDGRLSDCYLRSMGMTKEQFYFRVLEAFVKVIGVLICYRWGVIGIAYSIVLTNTISKTIKISYISNQVGISVRNTLYIIVKSWRFCLILVPVSLLGCYFMPHNIIGYFLRIILFVITVIVVFVGFPNFVGEEYTNTVYVRLNSIINKIKKRI